MLGNVDAASTAPSKIGISDWPLGGPRGDEKGSRYFNLPAVVHKVCVHISHEVH